ncbi:hypothetical protein SESBI_01073 [Sesbania bispinosa]|nr:hypothetical protein SESBI_01073 [Sesbania bispinosa]
MGGRGNMRGRERVSTPQNEGTTSDQMQDNVNGAGGSKLLEEGEKYLVEEGEQHQRVLLFDKFVYTSLWCVVLLCWIDMESSLTLIMSLSTSMCTTPFPVWLLLSRKEKEK